MPETQKELKEWIDSLQLSIKGAKRALIVPHDYPDPDALASAAGLHLILNKFSDVQPTIAFTGMVSRPENREMMKQIPLSMDITGSLRFKDKSIPVFFVDTAPWAGNVSVPSTEGDQFILDHHPIPAKEKKNTRHRLIQPDVGATTTLMYELLCLAEVQIPPWLATMMVYAISTETLDMMREVTDRDVKAYSALISKANLGNLGRIRHAPLPRDYYGYLQEAVTRAKVYGRINWTVMTSVDKPEIVAELADFLLRMERISWSFCVARQDDVLLISLRSCQPKAQCGKVIKKAFGRRGSAGGHDSMAAGSIPIRDQNHWNEEAEALIQKLIRLIETERLSDDTDLSSAGQPLVLEAVAPVE